jgi:hypothetical protein
MEGKIDRCHHCGEDKADCYYGFIAMTIPIPEAEAKIEKWNLIDAYNNYADTVDKMWLKSDIGDLDDFLYDRILLDDGEGIRLLTQEEFNHTIKLDPEFSKKWYTKDWFKNLERTDLTEEQMKELDDLCFYDQMLNTVGRGIQCDDCGRKESQLYEKYYPKSLES